MSDINMQILIEQAQNDDMNAMESIIRSYKGIINQKAKSYYIIGADSEDVIQEAMIGLVKAIKTYDKNKEASFKTYADICITRQLITSVRAANREKHTPLNNFVSLNKNIDSNDGRYESNDFTLGDMLEEKVSADAQTIVVINDVFSYIRNNEKLFSKFETEVWNYFVEGNSYDEISIIMGKKVKSIYNAMGRVKKKILDYLNG